MMDLQAHLSEYEVIGLLGGHWDSEALRIRVQAAFPCERACGSDSIQGVELDPQAELAAREAMTAQGLVPVGWWVLSSACPHTARQPSVGLSMCILAGSMSSTIPEQYKQS